MLVKVIEVENSMIVISKNGKGENTKKESQVAMI
jgi:hypothetical protein